MCGRSGNFTALDLTELETAIIDRPTKSMHIDATSAGITMSSQQRYTVGDLYIASVLASAGLQRFVEENFHKLALLRLGMGDVESKAFKVTFERWGNPNPESIDALFLRVGIVGITRNEFGGYSVEGYRPLLNQINRRRNDVVHGGSKTGTYRTELGRHEFGPDQIRGELKAFSREFLNILSAVINQIN